MTGVLVLNASFEPLSVVSTRRAVVLAVTDVVDVIADDPNVVFRTVSGLEVPAPKVVRLRRYVKIPVRKIACTRRAILARDRHTCAYCAGPADTIDHIVPRSRGGRHEWGNVTAACRDCNGRKADRTPAQMGWPTPNAGPPAGARWLVVGVADIDPDWVEWIPGS